MWSSMITASVADAGARSCVRAGTIPVMPNSDVNRIAECPVVLCSTQIFEPGAVLRCIGHAASAPCVHVHAAAWTSAEPAGTATSIADASWLNSHTTATRPRIRRIRVIEETSSPIRTPSVQSSLTAAESSNRVPWRRAAASPQLAEIRTLRGGLRDEGFGRSRAAEKGLTAVARHSSRSVVIGSTFLSSDPADTGGGPGCGNRSRSRSNRDGREPARCDELLREARPDVRRSADRPLPIDPAAHRSSMNFTGAPSDRMAMMWNGVAGAAAAGLAAATSAR
jgi:hypothetical protein